MLTVSKVENSGFADFSFSTEFLDLLALWNHKYKWWKSFKQNPTTSTTILHNKRILQISLDKNLVPLIFGIWTKSFLDWWKPIPFPSHRYIVLEFCFKHNTLKSSTTTITKITIHISSTTTVNANDCTEISCFVKQIKLNI